MSQSTSLIDAFNSSSELGRFSISGGGTMTNCKRCKAAMPESYIFCALCGYSTKPKSQRAAELPVVPPRSAASRQSVSTDTSTIGRRRKKVPHVSLEDSKSTTLNLPQPIIDGIQKLLSAPTLDNKSLTKRTIQEFKTQLLEIRNAEDIEIAVLNKQTASLGLEAQMKQGTKDFAPEYSPSLQQSTKAKSASTGRTKKGAQPPPLVEYLNEVESISNHYSRYLERLKQLEGLRAALMEAPPMPSEQLKDIRRAPKLSEQHEEGSNPAVDVGAFDLDLTHAAQDADPPSITAINKAQDFNAISVEVQDVSGMGSGMAFMWGPVFNAGGSVADTSLYSSITAPPGVQYLDFQTEVDDEAAGSKTASKPSSPGSRNSSRSASPTASTSQSNNTSTPTKIAPHPLEADPQSAAPVVMFWGNIMQNEADLLDDGTPSAHLSRTSSFRSIRTDSSAAEIDEEQHLAAEEAELPAWIEALAAETAGIRAEFQEEDQMIMDALGSRFRKMDVANITMQSRRALLVQYSMDGVVTEYREKIKQMKATMGLKPSRPGTAGDGDPDAANMLLLGSGDALLGVHEEKRAMEETEESRPIEAPQILTRKVSVDGQLQQRRLSNKGILQSTGEVLMQIEKQEEEEAMERDKKQTEDELAMQELILSLTQAHLQATGNKVAAGAPKSALQGDVLDHSAAEHRIGALLDQAERLEEHDKHARESNESGDELALHQWLVAVTAFDANRARKQTLRTLQLEELEDRMGDDSDDEDEDRGAAASTNASSNASSKAPTLSAAELAAATIDVPENNSLAAIKTLYRQSCSKMLASLPELNVDFTIDQTEQADFRMEARTKLQFARRILKTSSNVDHKVAVEYRKFLDFCSVRRAALAMELSEAMLRASELEKSYRDRYAEATREYKRSADALLADTSDTVKHVTTSKHMQAIKLSAELDINQQGAVVRTLQANEAKLLLDTRQEQYVLSEVLGIWQARHSKVLHRYSLAFKRLSGLLEAK